MTTETMTVHEALCEIKTIDDRITKAVRDVNPCATKKHSAINIDGISVDTFADRAKASYQKAQDLIRRADAIKRAISKSNASTVVVIDGKEMTVAEAIYEMQHGVDSKQYLLRKLRDEYNLATNKIKESERELERRCDNYIRDNYGGKDKADPAVIEKARRAFIDDNTVDLVDPLDVHKLIGELSDEIDRFSVAVDSALQTSNANTKITIEY